MPTPGLLLAAAAAVLLLLMLLALKLRGPRGPGDLTGPPKRRRRRIGWSEARRLGALIAAGDREAARRRFRELGYEEAEAAKYFRFADRLEAPSEPAARPPEPGSTD
jgi:hypothetical protein